MRSSKGAEPRERALASFTVELDAYSGPYEWLLALILKDELEIFEVPLRELVALYRNTYSSPESPTPGALERDTDFVDSATSLVLLKGRALAPVFEEGGEEADEGGLSLEDLEERLATFERGPWLEDGKMLSPKLACLRRAGERTTLNLTIHEGRNRIIRRACAAVGLPLLALKRVRVGPVKLGGLPEGRYRELTEKELEILENTGRRDLG